MSVVILRTKQWRNQEGEGGTMDICPRTQHFGGAILKIECYALVAQRRMPTAATQLRNLIKITIVRTLVTFLVGAVSSNQRQHLV